MYVYGLNRYPGTVLDHFQVIFCSFNPLKEEFKVPFLPGFHVYTSNASTSNVATSKFTNVEFTCTSKIHVPRIRYIVYSYIDWQSTSTMNESVDTSISDKIAVKGSLPQPMHKIPLGFPEKS